MSYGSSAWQNWVLDEEASLPIIKYAYDRGINFIGEQFQRLVVFVGHSP
jgi:aryl-alcohol dehydrogenase-like predicted oxidoreductase